MRFLSLKLRHFRNYGRLDIALPPGPVVLLGENAQGKTNLLEALYLLCTGRSPRADSDAEFVQRGGEVPAAWPLTAYLMAEAQRRDGPLRVEMAIVAAEPRAMPAPLAPGPGLPRSGMALPRGKQIRINGHRRRLLDMVGQVASVLFTAHDLELIPGPPSLRRRYLDITIAQVDRAYLAALQRYSQVLPNRNHLLRRIREGSAKHQELAFWDEELVRLGSQIVRTRAQVVASLGQQAAEAHGLLSEGREELALAYRPSPDPWLEDPGLSQEEVAAFLRRALEERREREVAAAVTLVGPHRDDLVFYLDGLPAAGYSSRGQQRTIALSLRLAEARYLEARRGEAPVLLLDDVLSELDARRRRLVIQAVAPAEQVFITATDPEPLRGEALAGAATFRVAEGRVGPWS